VRYLGTLDADVAILNRDTSMGVFGACEFVQLKRDDLGGVVCSSCTTSLDWERVMDGVEERLF
jgi:hypothetical protein